MSKLNLKKLVSLDVQCWNILEREAGARMQSVYVRNAIKHYSDWRKAGEHILLVKDDTIARRFDANNINMRIIELENNYNDTLDTLNNKIVEIISLKKQLSKHQEKEGPRLKKWWHFFFVGFRK
jgi:ArsR family metal-binding transcriptional regulator